MRYRVDQLAARAGVSVDTVRFYQSKGLLPQPQREGRVAWYSEDHLELLARIKGLKDKGFTLASIARMLSGDLDPADEALVTALLDGTSEAGALTLEELAEKTGVSPALLEAIEREGLLAPRVVDGAARYSASDVATVKAGLELLGTGLPLSELLALAREHDQAMRASAKAAVEMFVRFVRDPIRASANSDEDAAAELVAAFQKMLPATTQLVARHFERLVLAEAGSLIEKEVSETSQRSL
jgi:DNA-binding transcriptional MerR regulator